MEQWFYQKKWNLRVSDSFLCLCVISQVQVLSVPLLEACKYITRCSIPQIRTLLYSSDYNINYAFWRKLETFSQRMQFHSPRGQITGGYWKCSHVIPQHPLFPWQVSVHKMHFCHLLYFSLSILEWLGFFISDLVPLEIKFCVLLINLIKTSYYNQYFGILKSLKDRWR